MYKKSIAHYIAKIMVDVLFYVSIICVFVFPFVSRKIFVWIGYMDPLYANTFTIMVFTSGLFSTYILFQLKQMYTSLLTGNPFIDKNVRHFRRMAVACMIIAIIYIIKAFFMFTISTVVIALIFLAGCLFCLTLKDLFKQAINYKSENDLTI